jgi:hypothetical protein
MEKAIKEDNLEEIRRLIVDERIDVRAKGYYGDETAVQRVIESGDKPDIVRLLVEQNVEVLTMKSKVWQVCMDGLLEKRVHCSPVLDSIAPHPSTWRAKKTVPVLSA